MLNAGTRYTKNSLTACLAMASVEGVGGQLATVRFTVHQPQKLLRRSMHYPFQGDRASRIAAKTRTVCASCLKMLTAAMQN